MSLFFEGNLGRIRLASFWTDSCRSFREDAQISYASPQGTLWIQEPVDCQFLTTIGDACVLRLGSSKSKDLVTLSEVCRGNVSVALI